MGLFITFDLKDIKILSDSRMKMKINKAEHKTRTPVRERININK